MRITLSCAALAAAVLSACAHPDLGPVQASCAQAASASGELKAQLDGLRTDYAQLRADYDKLLAMIEGPARAEREPPPPPSKVDVPIDGAPAIGPADAKVVIVEFSDFECPFCARVQPTLMKVRDTWPKDVKLVFRHLPLPFHPNAMLAAKASEAAGRQGKFWPMHDLLFEHRDGLEAQAIDGYAKQLKLDMKRFKRDLQDPALEARVKADAELAERVGANGTPAFFINGWPVMGAQPFEEFKAKVEAELAGGGT